MSSPLSTSSPISSSPISSIKRKTMSVTQTYYLAHTARGKLSHEAARSDHNLRLLVGHANLLDTLMLDLASAEQEQESWFNQSVKKASHTQESRHIQWADAIVEDPSEDWQAEDAEESDTESEYDSDEDIEMDGGLAPLHRVPSHTSITITSEEFTDEDEDEEEDYASLTLHRTNSHSASSSSLSPPELDDDSDSSEDDSMPPSPPSTSLPSFSEKERRQIATTSFYSTSQSGAAVEEQPLFPYGATGLVSAISVY